MFQVVRNYYALSTLISGTDTIAAAITAGTLQNGDVLYYSLTTRIYGTVVGNAVTLATN
jgi:hypothetical protein